MSQQIRDALETVEKLFAESPEKARVSNFATASLAGGLKFAVTGARGETLTTDMPKGVGGDASEAGKDEDPSCE